MKPLNALGSRSPPTSSNAASSVRPRPDRRMRWRARVLALALAPAAAAADETTIRRVAELAERLDAAR